MQGVICTFGWLTYGHRFWVMGSLSKQKWRRSGQLLRVRHKANWNILILVRFWNVLPCLANITNSCYSFFSIFFSAEIQSPASLFLWISICLQLFQFDNKDECKVIHTKWLAGFDSDDLEKMQQKMKILVAFFYQVFTRYNIQFWGMLPSKADNPKVPTLSYSWEAAMQKLAEDSVHR